MIVRETSWHYKFQKLMRGREKISSSLCGYFWGFVVSALKLLFITLMVLFCGVCMYYSAAQLWGAGGGPLAIFGNIIWAIVAIIILWAALFITWAEVIEPWNERRKLNAQPKLDDSLWDIVRGWISAQYRKVCPLIQFDDGKKWKAVPCMECNGKGRFETLNGPMMDCLGCNGEGSYRKRVMREKGEPYSG